MPAARVERTRALPTDMTGPRILLVRPDHLGDVLLTLPAVAVLRRCLPNAQVTYLVGPAVGELLQRCPQLDAVRTLRFPSPPIPPPPADWAEQVAAVAPTLRGRFDIALLPRPDDPWSGALVAAAGIPLRIGYARPWTRPFLTTALPVVPGRHVTEEALALCRVVAAVFSATGQGVAELDGPPLIIPTPADRAEALALIGSLSPHPGAQPVVLHPGSGWRLKNWPPPRWGELARRLAERYGLAPLVTGGPDEGALVEAVVAASHGRAVGAADRLSIGGLAALHRRARLVVATDAGPLHLAALVGAPVVGLYGPVGPAQFGPWCPPERRRLVHVPPPCSPCGTLVAPPCGALTEPACISAITVDTVLAAVTELLTTSRADRVVTG